MRRHADAGVDSAQCCKPRVQSAVARRVRVSRAGVYAQNTKMSLRARSAGSTPGTGRGAVRRALKRAGRGGRSQPPSRPPSPRTSCQSARRGALLCVFRFCLGGLLHQRVDEGHSKGESSKHVMRYYGIDRLLYGRMIVWTHILHIFNRINKSDVVRSITCWKFGSGCSGGSESSVLLLFAGGDNGSSSSWVNRSGPVY